MPYDIASPYAVSDQCNFNSVIDFVAVFDEESVFRSVNFGHFFSIEFHKKS